MIAFAQEEPNCLSDVKKVFVYSTDTSEEEVGIDIPLVYMEPDSIGITEFMLEIEERFRLEINSIHEYLLSHMNLTNLVEATLREVAIAIESIMTCDAETTPFPGKIERGM